MDDWEGNFVGLPPPSLAAFIAREHEQPEYIPLQTVSSRHVDIYAPPVPPALRSDDLAASLIDDSPQEIPIRGQQIHEDIDTSNHICEICLDSVQRADRVWYCQGCWHIVHYRCATNAANGRARTSVGSAEMAAVAINRAWKCPSCRLEHGGQPWEMCWCTRSLWDDKEPREYFSDWSLPPNSCGHRCLKALPCHGHNRFSTHQCNAICHAGPCPPCSQGCQPSRSVLAELVKARLTPARPINAPITGPINAPITRTPEQDYSRGRTRMSTTRSGRDRMSTVPTRMNAQRESQSITPSVRLRKADTDLLILSLLSTTVTIFWTYYVVVIITQPYNHRSVAEKNDAVRAIWAFAGIFGVYNMIINLKTFKMWGNFFETTLNSMTAYDAAHRWVPCCTNLCDIIFTWVICFWHVAKFGLGVIWILGPFFAPIGVPLIARDREFKGVCDGFDTRVLLDIGKSQRQFPTFKDLGPSALQAPKLGAPTYWKDSATSEYQMAIIVPPLSPHPSETSSLNLNSYKPSLRPVFGIPADHKVANFSNVRSTTYRTTDPEHSYQYIDLTHNEEGRRFNHRLGDLIPEPVDDFLNTLVTAENLLIMEDRGVYGIDFDWENSTWTSRIDSVPVNNGTFSLGPDHLVLPSLGLQIPNFAQFTRSCKYEPFLKMYRGNGSLAEIERQGREGYRYDSEDLVLRAAAFGTTQGGLELCARRRDTLDGDGRVVRRGLGPEVHVAAGLVASWRWREWSLGRRKGCKGVMLKE